MDKSVNVLTCVDKLMPCVTSDGKSSGNVSLVKGINGGKATVLDNIPCKLLKVAADVI